MANALADRRFILDTAAATLLMNALMPGAALTLQVKGIRWVGGTTAGHACIIQDSDSVVLWESLASGSNYVESDLQERRWTKDFKLVTLGSGRVYVYFVYGNGFN